MEFETVYTAKKERSKEEFLRALLIELAHSTKTPIDVVNASFGEVQESVREAILCTAHVEMDYSTSIGFDRIETYWVKEQKYDSTTKRYYSVDVPKQRTVTDWQPFQGHIAGDKSCFAFNDDDSSASGIAQHNRLTNVIKSVKRGNIVPKGESEVSDAGLETVKQNCAAVLEMDIRYPGDRHRDTQTQPLVTVNDVTCFKLPYYEVEYIYKGKKYHASGFACGNINLEAEYPPNDVDVVSTAAKETKPYRIGMFVGWLAFCASFILACVLVSQEVFLFWIIPLVLLAAAVALHLISNKKYTERIRTLTENTYLIKQKELETVLSDKGYDRLTEEEKTAFPGEDEGKTIALKHKRRGVKLPAILGSLAMVVLIIVSSVCGSIAKSNALHSPEQFSISVTSKTQEYKSNVSPYLNGCYYIYLTYRVDANEIGANGIGITTTVYGKNGNKIGTLETNLSDMNLDPGAGKTYSTYLKENQPEENQDTFFIALYNAEYAELTFEIEITDIYFSDGKFWYSEDD